MHFEDLPTFDDQVGHDKELGSVDVFLTKKQVRTKHGCHFLTGLLHKYYDDITSIENSVKVLHIMVTNYDVPSILEEDFRPDFVHENSLKSVIQTRAGDRYDRILDGLSTYDLCMDLFHDPGSRSRNEVPSFPAELIFVQEQNQLRELSESIFPKDDGVGTLGGSENYPVEFVKDL